jgi:hypothetical protein|tara:strand:+ start:347 stop:553 length:207 start_codon:yes stop_codon:yes gene_type:complete
MIKKTKDNAKLVSVVSSHLHIVISELKQLNKHLDKTQYLMYEYMSKDWTDEKKQKVLSELAWWGLKDK